jgi:hypothetical protein
MKGHRLRLDAVQWRSIQRQPAKFRPGERVRSARRRDHGSGAVVAVFTDYRAAIEVGFIREEWYELQRPAPRASMGEYWYAVLFADGAVLEGETDLEPHDVGSA